MTICIVTGPPAAGKTTWVREHARPGDITIDYDAIANALTPPDGKPHEHLAHIKAVAKAARQAAIDAALRQAAKCDVYIIHSRPGAATVARYQALGAKIVTIDPGRDVVLARCKAERPWRIGQAARQWYDHAASPQVRGPTGASGAADRTRDW